MNYTFAKRTERMRASIIREILKMSAGSSDMISFAGGLPAPATFPLEDFGIAVDDTLREDGTRALQYTLTEGHLGLKQYLCGWLKKQGINCSPEEMLLTHGSQQALDLLAKIFINPGDTILIEDPTYLGAIQSFNSYEANYLTVAINGVGMDPTEVEEKLNSHSVRFGYVMPTFHNPAGTTMQLDRRQALVKLARQKGIPLIEDDPYGVLRFKGESLPTLFSLANGQGVIYLSTFSKLLSPGIRLGFVVAEKSIIQQLVYAKQATDLQNNTFIQYAAYHYCKRGFLEKHIPEIRADYEHRAGVMIAAMRRHFPPDVKYYEPQGGMFVWCELPKHIKTKDVFKKSLEEKVAFVDGSVFFANGGGENTMRLNFTASTDSDLQIGVERLARVIKSFL